MYIGPPMPFPMRMKDMMVASIFFWAVGGRHKREEGKEGRTERKEDEGREEETNGKKRERGDGGKRGDREMGGNGGGDLSEILKLWSEGSKGQYNCSLKPFTGNVPSLQRRGSQERKRLWWSL
jgi:hypothetical protein